MKELIFLKLGGSLITEKSKPYTLREHVLQRVCKEIHVAREEKSFSLLLGHGGGSFPHTSAAKYQTHRGYINEESKKGFCIVQNDASTLNRIVVKSLINIGENAVSVQPSACCIADNGRIVKWYMEPLIKYLEDDYIPVTFGDVVLDKTKGCCIVSTEEIFRFLALKLKPTRIILAGKVDGIYDSDGNLIPEITTKNFNEIKACLKGSDATDVTGGMLHKVQEMLELVKLGIESIIINGLKEDAIKKALLGERVAGTVIC